MDPSPLAALHPSYDPERRLLVLTLDHGKANEMGTEQLDALTRLCAHLEADASVSCLLTTSRRTSKKGTPIFIAGANVTERTGWDDERVKAHVLRQRALMRRLRRLPLFTVVLSHGVTLGWGTEYLLTADYCLATPTASFGLPETGLGILPGARGTAELAQLVGPAQALRLGCTGETVGAEEALRIGLVQEVVADLDAGLSRVHALAEQLCRRSPTAVAAYKRALLDGLGQPEAVRLDCERQAYEHTVDTGEAAVGRASFAAIREGKAPQWGPRR
ncbi:MAG: enoyl-CoA hydratase/isomerase family protein [Myxococcales bacterium]|nr:enoyl-CoA hydratase/isomerase family protein [Myxococcales bacterium]